MVVDATPLWDAPVVIPDLSDLGCSDGCGAGRYCRRCREGIRAEALLWLSDIADGHDDRRDHSAGKLVLLAPSALGFTHP